MTARTYRSWKMPPSAGAAQSAAAAGLPYTVAAVAVTTTASNDPSRLQTSPNQTPIFLCDGFDELLFLSLSTTPLDKEENESSPFTCSRSSFTQTSNINPTNSFSFPHVKIQSPPPVSTTNSPPPASGAEKQAMQSPNIMRLLIIPLPLQSLQPRFFFIDGFTPIFSPLVQGCIKLQLS